MNNTAADFDRWLDDQEHSAIRQAASWVRRHWKLLLCSGLVLAVCGTLAYHRLTAPSQSPAVQEQIRQTMARFAEEDRLRVQEAASSTSPAVVPKIAPLPAVFQNPARYTRMPIAKAARMLHATPNRVKNIVVETPTVHLLLENKDRTTVSYVDVTLKGSGPCVQTQPFDSTPLLAAVGVDAPRLTLIRKAPHAHTYMDHANHVKVTVICSEDGSPFSVGFSATYYEPF